VARTEHGTNESLIVRVHSRLFETAKCPDEAGRGRDDEAKTSAALAWLLPTLKPAGLLERGDPTAEPRPIPSREDEGLELGEREDSEPREPEEDGAVAREARPMDSVCGG